MNINLTLIVQMIVFALLIFGTMKWIWPQILTAMDERSRKIAQGLAAAEKSEQALTEARGNAEVIIRGDYFHAATVAYQDYRSKLFERLTFSGPTPPTPD